jgi:NAD(P)-dependent dehydrogenase (short-subunit alcohol dehydrogenase family)
MLRLRCSFGRLDVAVNNAGTEGHPGPVTEQTPESYAAVFDTNVLGTLLGMKHEMLVMAAQGGGSILISHPCWARLARRAPRSIRRASTPLKG